MTRSAGLQSGGPAAWDGAPVTDLKKEQFKIFENGKEEKMHTSGFLFKSDIALPPGRYSVRFVVHDNVGQRTGSVAAPLLVKN